MKRDLEVVTAQAQSPKWGVASIGVMTRMWATCRPYALDRPIGRLCEERTFIRDDVNDRNWVESCRLRLADWTATFRPCSPMHSIRQTANGRHFACRSTARTQSRFFKASLPEAPF